MALIIRWSLEAWEALYPDPSARWWKPWPHLDELRKQTADAILDAFNIPQSLRDAWAAIKTEAAP